MASVCKAFEKSLGKVLNTILLALLAMTFVNSCAFPRNRPGTSSEKKWISGAPTFPGNKPGTSSEENGSLGGRLFLETSLEQAPKKMDLRRADVFYEK